MEEVCNGKTQSNGTDGYFRSFLPSKLCSKELFYQLWRWLFKENIKWLVWKKKRSVDVLQVLEDYIVENGKPHKILHDNGKQFTSKIFRHFLQRNNIKDKSIPARYPQLQGKIEAYNKIVKNEFLAVENIRNVEDGKRMYAMFVKAYNEEREHGGINGHTPSEMFLMKGRLNSCKNIKTIKQIKSVTHVGKWICYLSM